MTKNQIESLKGYIISGNINEIEEFIKNLNICLNSTELYIQLRLKLDSNENILNSILSKVDNAKLNRLLLNSGTLNNFENNLKLVKLLKLGGLHLTSDVLLNCSDLESLIEINKDLVWVGSCHNSEEIKIANNLKLDFIVISPILPSISCPSDSTLGWDKFRSLVQVSKVPVYGLGGLDLSHLKQVESSGAQGVAAIHSFWQLHKFQI